MGYNSGKRVELNYVVDFEYLVPQTMERNDDISVAVTATADSPITFTVAWAQEH